jgi:hypothetical protein
LEPQFYLLVLGALLTPLAGLYLGNGCDYLWRHLIKK